jgi:hypothetical protein
VDALNTKCSKCTEIQRGYIKKAAKFLSVNRPEEWQKLIKTLDPDGTHAQGLAKFIQEP